MKPFLAALLITVGLALAAGSWLWLSSGGEPVTVIVPRGASNSAVAEILAKNGIVSTPVALRTLLRVTGGAQRVRAGEFRFRLGMAPLRALSVLYYGEPILRTVTVPEGWTVRQIARAVADAGLGSEQKILALTLKPEAAARYKLHAPSLEGFLFPDTYRFSRIDGEERIVDKMVSEFFRRFDKSLQDEAAKLGFTTESLATLASIIEKETGASGERELIASVFHNRLKKGMRLQSDPTTIYGIPNFNGNLTRADLLRPTAYNTYTIKALPPGPIASPGLPALTAALRPANTRYLYFVANNRGGHVFSETYAEHDANVDLHQRKRKPDAARGPGSAPRDRVPARAPSKPGGRR